jgi:hypothetical protein
MAEIRNYSTAMVGAISHIENQQNLIKGITECVEIST